MITTFEELASALCEASLNDKEPSGELLELFQVYQSASGEALELGYVGVGCISHAERVLINYQKNKEQKYP